MAREITHTHIDLPENPSQRFGGMCDLGVGEGVYGLHRKTAQNSNLSAHEYIHK